MQEHTVKSFDQELQLLDKKVAQMGGLAERLLARSFDALERRDPKLAEMAVKAETGRAVTYHALRLFHDGQDALREVTIAKLKTQRDAFDVADDALQIHGGAGYMREYDIERAARDARLGPIGGGTDEIMKEILGRTLGL